MSQKIETGYTPRPLQERLHCDLKRFNVLVCHRRFGKTVFSINEMLDQGLRCERKNPQYAYFAPFYGQAKRVAWDYLKDFTKSIPGATTNEADLRVDIPRPDRGDRIRFMLLGADNPGAIRGIYLDGCILDEYAEMDPTIWGQVIRPALSDRLGWAIFIGTPKGQNHFYDILQTAKKTDNWHWVVFKASQTGVVEKSELMAAAAEMSEEEYDQEFECSFAAALTGAYYGKILNELEDKGRITRVPYDSGYPVHTGWDLGISDTTTVWFYQQIGREKHLIDYEEDAGIGLDEWAKVIKNKPYVYGEHYFPHDAAARELGTGKSRVETLRSLGIRPIVNPRQSVEDGIHAVRMMLSTSWFDMIKCEKGLNALRNYQRKWDPKNKIYIKRPMHNWASHGADGFRTLAMGLKGDDNGFKTGLLPRSAEVDYDTFGGS